MAIRSQSTALTTEKKARKPRTAVAKHYLAKLYGAETPVIVVAKSEADAINALVTLRAASYEDMMTSGRLDHPVVDVTKGQQTAGANPKPTATLTFGSAASEKTE
jgi:hypothetical protein